MAFSASAAMALIAIIYRITVNLPDMPFSANLKNKTSTDFVESSQQVVDAVNFLIKPIPGFHNVTVKEFRYQQVVGTMVIMDILSTNTHDIESFKKLFEDSIQEGHIGWLAVAPEGFELHTMKVNATKDGKFDFSFAKPTVTCPDNSIPEYSLHGSTYCWSHSVCPSGTACIQNQCCRTPIASTIRKCPETKWECGDGNCLRMSLRCDGLRDCSDAGDEYFCIESLPSSFRGK